MKDIINGFMEWNKKMNKAEKTIKMYNDYIVNFVDEYQITIENINQLENKEFAKRFIDDELNKNLKPGTINKHKNILSTFSNFLVFEDIIESNKFKEMSSIKNDSHKVSVYTDEDIKRIFDYMDNKIKEDKFQRHIDKQVYIVNMTAIKLLYKNALRISEAVSIEMNDFNLDNGNKFYIHGKGGHGKVTRFNSFSNDMIDLINKVLEIRSNIEIKDGNEKYFFISPISKSKITEASLRKFLKNILAELNIEYNSPAHDMRHSKLSELVSKGVEISKVASFAGHKSAKTTEAFYIHPVESTMDELVNL